jgi:hypothetical protein
VYKLRYTLAVESVWDALPDDARDEFERALIRVCEDPYATTGPHGEDGDVKRILTLQHTRAVIVIIETPTIKRVRIQRLAYLG